MKKILIIVILVILTSLASSQNPGVTGSGYSFFHTYEGRVLNPGYLDVYANSNFYTRAGEYLGTPPPNFKAVNMWLVAGNIAASYGIIPHLDMTLSFRVYQDTHHPNEYNLPDDIFLTIKGGSFKFARRHFAGAIQSTLRIPTGEVHNYPFAEYASGALEFGFMGALSHYTDPYFPDRKFSFHYNVGVWFHNEKGKEINIPKRDPRVATISSSKLGMALALQQPLGLFDLRLELSGYLYMQKPDSFVYSAEDVAYITPSLRYKPLDWLSLDLGMDVRLSPSDRQRTSGVPDVSDKLDLPSSYPPWKVQMGVQFKVLPVGRKSYDSDIRSLRAKRALDYYNMIMEESEEAKKMEDKVRELRQERKSADEQIDDIKTTLDEG